MAVERERVSRPGLWVSGLLALGIAAFCLPQPRDPSQAPLLVGGLGLGALLLQATAAELPGNGLFSAAPALTMAAASLNGVGAGLACLMSLSSLFVRSLVRPRRNFLYTLQENLADAVPELATICLIAQGAGLWGCLAYVPLALFWPRLMALGLGRQRSSLLGLYTGVACAGVLAACLELPAFPWRLAPLFLVLAAAQQRLPAPAVGSRRPLSGWGRPPVPEPPRKSQEQLALEYLAKLLSGCRNQLGVLDALLQVVTVVPCRSQVVFLCQDGRLLPARYQSPLRERLDGYALLNLPEPVVEKAWRTHTSLAFPPLPDNRARLFEGEHAGAALVLPGEGVLYLGRPEPPLTGDELHLLELVAAQAGTALRAVRSQECERLAVEQYRREHTRLEEELQRLQSLLEGTRQMASTLDNATLEERLQLMLAASIPHQFGAVLTLQDGQLHLRRQWGAPLHPPAAVAVAQAVLSNGLPLTLLGQSRLAPLVPHQTALVAAPMQLEQGSTGVLLLGSTTGSFEREHQDLLWMIGCLAAVCFSNAGLHQEVVSAQAQLLHAGKLAAIGQLAAGVAHELNTPLGAIRLCLEGLTRQLTKEPNPGMQRKLDRALMAADQAHQIVDKLLVYSRDDRSEHETVDLHQVVSQTLELVSAQLSRDKVLVELDLAPVPPVKGSLLELRQVLTNLLMNARDAALSPGATRPASGYPSLRIQTRRQDDWVLLQVFDYGPGVAPELVSRIFEPFFTTKPVGRGTGLGLSISHSIAAKHAGTLEYESPPEGGACFFLRLPVN